jgi:hypothetical protein
MSSSIVHSLATFTLLIAMAHRGLARSMADSNKDDGYASEEELKVDIWDFIKEILEWFWEFIWTSWFPLWVWYRLIRL